MSLKKAVMAVQGDYKDKIIGVGLDSSEVGNPPNKFEQKRAQRIFRLQKNVNPLYPSDSP